ncbi:MAG: flagellar assembly protein FliH [Chromatiaceae bacterium]|nr:flagellar assembly protein FliH [Chromatiaceae bacterium]
MSEADAKITRGQDVPWRRWQMTELGPRREKAAANARPSAATRSTESAAQPGHGKHGSASASPPKAETPTAPVSRKAQPEEQQKEQQKQPQKGPQQAAEKPKRGRPTDAQKKALDAERKQVQEAARKEGHAAGLKAGQAEGYAKGLEEGRKAAREELEQQITETLKPVRNLALQFSDALALLNDEMAKDLVELALATGRHLAGEALDANPTQVVDLVRGLLHSEPAMHGKPRLWLHPRDYDLVNKYLGQELAAAGWALQPDDQVSRGGCRVTSGTGELDATWESRWHTVRQQVRSRRSASEQTAASQAPLDAAEAAAVEPDEAPGSPVAEASPVAEGPQTQPQADE